MPQFRVMGTIQVPVQITIEASSDRDALADARLLSDFVRQAGRAVTLTGEEEIGWENVQHVDDVQRTSNE